MIVYRENERLHIVTQVDHAQLSGTINEELIPVDLPSSVHSAIEHHDDGWSDWDRNPRLEQGRPVDYRSMSLDDHIPILRNSIDACQNIHPYAGWLVSRHGCSFHESKSDPIAKNFLKKEQQRRDRILDTNDLPDSKKRTIHFDILQFCDALSLFVISPWNDRWEWDRTNPGPVTIQDSDNDKFSVQSDSLSKPYGSFSVPVTSLRHQRYDSRDEFSEALETGTTVEKTIRLVPD